MIRFHLNGVATEVDADPDRSLLDILRSRLGLTGTHFGCGSGECGACHVIIGEHAVSSSEAESRPELPRSDRRWRWQYRKL